MNKGITLTQILVIVAVLVIGVILMSILIPLARQMAIVRALGSVENVAVAVSHLITISRSAPDESFIRYNIPVSEQDVSYSLIVDKRNVTVCRTEKENYKCEGTAACPAEVNLPPNKRSEMCPTCKEITEKLLCESYGCSWTKGYEICNERRSATDTEYPQNDFESVEIEKTIVSGADYVAIE